MNRSFSSLMMSPNWRFCSASSSGVICAQAASRWNLPNPPAERPSARRYYPLLLAASGNSWNRPR